MENTVSQQLALMQLSDSFFPSGSFTLSHGLESLIQMNRPNSSQPPTLNIEELETFIKILLHNKIGTSDVVALIHAYRGSQLGNLAAVKQADARLFAQTLIDRTRETQSKSGRALLMVANSTWQDSQLEILSRETANKQFYCLHPIIFAVVGRVVGLKERDTVLAFLHGLVTGLLGAAIRLGIVGHLKSQQVLGHLAPDIDRVYQTARSIELDAMCSCTPQIDLAQMQHQYLDLRLFAS
jgi:urease accessory protein